VNRKRRFAGFASFALTNGARLSRGDIILGGVVLLTGDSR
jgi:hypothetical protein